MNLSVIIVVSGDSIDRFTSAVAQNLVISRQTVKPCEIIYVEYMVDNNRYYDKLPFDFDGGYCKYVPIKFNEHPNLFSVGWGRNVGIQQSIGDTILLLDVDYIFDYNYFSTLDQYNISDALVGWDKIYYLNNSFKVDFLRYNKFPVESERVKLNDGGEFGGAQIFNRKWFDENIYGYSEDIFNWGADDTDVYLRAWTKAPKRMLNYTLYHFDHIVKYSPKLINLTVMQRNLVNVQDTYNKLKSVGVGKLDKPNQIYDDSVRWSES